MCVCFVFVIYFLVCMCVCVFSLSPSLFPFKDLIFASTLGDTYVAFRNIQHFYISAAIRLVVLYLRDLLFLFRGWVFSSVPVII